ncbi:hypothetical protein V8C86DRAFT_3135125, partial [Haematococcus lacustris]
GRGGAGGGQTEGAGPAAAVGSPWKNTARKVVASLLHPAAPGPGGGSGAAAAWNGCPRLGGCGGGTCGPTPQPWVGLAGSSCCLLQQLPARLHRLPAEPDVESVPAAAPHATSHGSCHPDSHTSTFRQPPRLKRA